MKQIKEEITQTLKNTCKTGERSLKQKRAMEKIAKCTLENELSLLDIDIAFREVRQVCFNHIIHQPIKKD